ncbi:MAG: hypothetical protein ACKV19_10380 [Verrucomicrobiales bacterium]
MRFPRVFVAIGLLGSLSLAPTGTGGESAAISMTRRSLGEKELVAAVAPGGRLWSRIESLGSSIPRGETGEFDAFLKAEWLIDAIVRPVHSQLKTHVLEIESAFVQGTRASWENRSLSHDYLGHQFRFLRIHTLGGRPGLLFRSAGERGQLNYCLFAVAAGPDGTLSAEDLYVVGMGEWLSDTLRRGYLTLVESLDPRGESGRRASLYVESLADITAMQAALIRKDYSKVLALSSSLPPEVLQDRQILLTRLEAAENISLAERTRLFAEWKALHPNPEQLPLKWADFHLAAGRFEEARSVLAALNTRIGGDTHLMLRLGEIKMLAAHHAAGKMLGGRPGLDASTPESAESLR